MALMSGISMAPIQGGSLVHLQHNEEWQILILPFWHGVQIKGALKGSEILMISLDHLALLTWSMLPKECPYISFLLRLQPLQNCI